MNTMLIRESSDADAAAMLAVINAAAQAQVETSVVLAPAKQKVLP